LVSANCGGLAVTKEARSKGTETALSMLNTCGWKASPDAKIQCKLFQQLLAEGL